MKITTAEATKLIFATHGRLFGATFKKKDGTIRHITARLGVRKGVKGVEKDRAETDRRLNMVTVFDFNADRNSAKNKGNFRRINLTTLTRLQIGGNKYEIA